MPDASIDITREICPMTYVRVKLAAEALPNGATLEVLLRGAEPERNVPLSARADGHEVVSVHSLGDGSCRLTIRIHHRAE